MRHAVFVDKADGDDVVALPEHAFWNVIAAWRVLVVGMANLLSIEVGDVLVEKRTQQQPCRFACMSLVHLDVLP